METTSSHTSSKEANPPEKKRSLVKSIIVGGLGLLSLVYLINPTGGFIEILPDNIPGVGNLDEAGAAALLISCLAYFGFDLGSLFGKAKKHKQAKGEVIDVEESDN